MSLRTKPHKNIHTLQGYIYSVWHLIKYYQAYKEAGKYDLYEKNSMMWAVILRVYISNNRVQRKGYWTLLAQYARDSYLRKASWKRRANVKINEKVGVSQLKVKDFCDTDHKLYHTQRHEITDSLWLNKIQVVQCGWRQREAREDLESKLEVGPVRQMFSVKVQRAHMQLDAHSLCMCVCCVCVCPLDHRLQTAPPPPPVGDGGWLRAFQKEKTC